MIQLLTALAIREYFWPEFRELEGTVLLATAVPSTGIDWAKLRTRTEAESLYNHVHVLDLFRHRIPLRNGEHGFEEPDSTHPDFGRAMALGHRMAEMWLAKLGRDFPGRRFRVYWTKFDAPIVRFHEVRSDEPAWYTDEQAADGVEAGTMCVYETEFSERTSA